MDNANVQASAITDGGSVRLHRTARRGWLGAAIAVAGLAGVTAVLLPLRGGLSLAGVTLLYLVPVVATAVAGGVWPALAAAVAADLLLNFFFVPPYRTLAVDSPGNVIALLVYLFVAATVALAVDVAARHRAAAARRAVEAGLLAQISTAPAAAGSLTHLLERIRVAYGMSAVALLDGDTVVARVGDAAAGPAALSVDASPGVRLAAWGPAVFAEDRGTLSRLAAGAARVRENQRLADEAARARELAEIDRLRAALLDAVGHDLRTPLAGIKAAVSSLRQPDVTWAADDQAELLATIEESTDRLVDLVENLLSMSRLQAGVLSADPRPVALDAVVAEAVLHIPKHDHVELDVPDDLPLVLADPGLLQRVVANLLANAVAASQSGAPVQVRGVVAYGRLQLQVIDHGPGLPAADRERVFTPFQRLDDSSGTGLGLGLAIARGFTEAMDGTLTPSDTPGGGLTMTITLPAAP
jgi:two-component system sensor histidine kinase KdpD